jgi:hypothetical protein
VSRDFEDTWVPRIGAEATERLRQSANYYLTTIPLMFAFAIASSFLLSSSNSSEFALGVVAVLLTTALFILGIRSRIRLAAAVSEWFGVKVGWWEMPRMRTQQFDEWCSERGLAHAT